MLVDLVRQSHFSAFPTTAATTTNKHQPQNTKNKNWRDRFTASPTSGLSPPTPLSPLSSSSTSRASITLTSPGVGSCLAPSSSSLVPDLQATISSPPLLPPTTPTKCRQVAANAASSIGERWTSADRGGNGRPRTTFGDQGDAGLQLLQNDISRQNFPYRRSSGTGDNCSSVVSKLPLRRSTAAARQCLADIDARLDSILNREKSGSRTPADSCNGSFARAHQQSDRRTSPLAKTAALCHSSRQIHLQLENSNDPRVSPGRLTMSGLLDPSDDRSSIAGRTSMDSTDVVGSSVRPRRPDAIPPEPILIPADQFNNNNNNSNVLVFRRNEVDRQRSGTDYLRRRNDADVSRSVLGPAGAPGTPQTRQVGELPSSMHPLVVTQTTSSVQSPQKDIISETTTAKSHSQITNDETKKKECVNSPSWRRQKSSSASSEGSFGRRPSGDDNRVTTTFRIETLDSILTGDNEPIESYTAESGAAKRKNNKVDDNFLRVPSTSSDRL